jgi:hypothetical protein
MTGQTGACLSLPTSTPEAAMTLAPASTRTSLPIALWIVPVMVLVLAVFPLPYGYYTFTRVVAFLACIALAYTAYGRRPGATVWTTFFVLIAIVFNPLIPIYLKKHAWMYIDGAVAAVILAHLLSVILGASGREGGSRRTVVAAGPAARKLARSDDARRRPSYCGTKRNCRSSHISVGSFGSLVPTAVTPV